MTIVSHVCHLGKPSTWAHARRANRKGSLRREFGLFLIFLFVSTYALAEEQSFEPRPFSLAPILMVYGIAPLRVPSPSTTFAHGTSRTMELSLENSYSMNSAEERQYDYLFKSSPRDNDAFVFLRRRVPSRFAYESWAKVKPGFGQLFPDDVVARSRTSGVGIQDPEWLYIKMSLRF